MKTQIEFEDDNFTFKNISKQNVTKQNLFVIIIIIFVIFFISTIFTILQMFNYKPLMELSKFKRIKKNMSSWLNITQEKSSIETNKGKLFSLTHASAFEFRIMDFGSYYAIGRINPNTYLPEFVRRGNSGPWIINKTSDQDLSAQQFALHILNKYVLKNTNTDHIITCGIDMYNKIGYSGYFNTNSVCEQTIPYLIKTLN